MFINTPTNWWKSIMCQWYMYFEWVGKLWPVVATFRNCVINKPSYFHGLFPWLSTTTLFKEAAVYNDKTMKTKKIKMNKPLSSTFCLLSCFTLTRTVSSSDVSNISKATSSLTFSLNGISLGSISLWYPFSIVGEDYRKISNIVWWNKKFYLIT